MKKIRFCSATALFALCVVACGTDASNGGKLENALNACELLPPDEVARLIGDEIESSQETLNMNHSGFAFSQCTHKPDGPGKRLNVQVRRSSTPIVQSRQADADDLRAEDDGTGMSIEMAAAVEKGRDLTGISDVAYAYETDETTHLVAYWKQRFQIQVWMSHESMGREKALQVLTAATQHVIGRLEK